VYCTVECLIDKQTVNILDVNALLASNGAWPDSYSFRFVVGRTGLHFLAESEQKILKVGILNFPA